MKKQEALEHFFSCLDRKTCKICDYISIQFHLLKCSVCGSPASKLCDFYVLLKPGKISFVKDNANTCDAPLCSNCSAVVDHGTIFICGGYSGGMEQHSEDYCPKHYKIYKETGRIYEYGFQMGTILQAKTDVALRSHNRDAIKRIKDNQNEPS
jgi:hypothetical protein